MEDQDWEQYAVKDKKAPPSTDEWDKYAVKKKEPLAPAGKPSAQNSQSVSTSSLGAGADIASGAVFKGMGNAPVAEEVAVEDKPTTILPTPRILTQKNKSFLDNDIDVSLKFSLKNPALNKTKDRIALSAPVQDGKLALDMPFDQKVALQKRQITTDPSLLKEYGRTRMQQIGQMASEFNSAADSSADPIMGSTVDNANSTALRNKANELQDYQKQFRESLKNQAAIAVTGKAIQLGQTPDPIQVGREVLDVISDPTLKDDEKVLAELKNPSKTIFTDAEGVSHEMSNTYEPTAIEKSQQNINYNLYRTGADAMRAYYDDARQEAFNKAPDKINSLTSLIDAWGKLTPQEQKNNFNPVNAQIQALKNDPAVNEFIAANIDYSKTAETSANAIKQFPQVERIDKIRRLNEAWFDLSNAKAAGGTYGSEAPRVWRWVFGDQPSESDIPSIARSAGITKEEAKKLIDEGGNGLFHVMAPNVRTSGFLPGMARGADETLDNMAMGIRRFFDPSSAATETKNRIQKDQMQERSMIAQGNMLKDDTGNWHINPMSIANVFGYGMGQTAIQAVPALASGGVAAEGSMLQKGLELVNTVVPGAAASYEDAWKTAKSNGADDPTAKAYAFWVALANGGAEAIYSPADVVKGISGGPSKKLLFNTFMKDVDSKGLNKTISSKIAEVGKEIWNKGKEPLNVLAAENVEEFATDVATNKLDQHYLNLKKTQAQLADQTFTTFIQTTFQTLPLAVGVGIGGTHDMSGVRKQTLFEVGQQPDIYKSLTKDLLDQQKITQAEYNTKLSHINQLQGIVANLPKQNAHGKQLSYDEAAELTAQQFRIDTNEQKLKSGTIAGEKPIIESDTKEAVKRQGEILNPELSEKVMYQGSEWTVKKDNGETVDIVKDDGLSHITINKSELGNLKTKEDEKVVFPVRNNDFAEKYFSKESPAGEESEFAKYQRLKEEDEDASIEMIANKKGEIIAAAELPKGTESGTKSEEPLPSTVKSEVNDNGKKVFINDKNGESTSSVSYKYNEGNKTIYIDGLETDFMDRGKGYASDLISFLKEKYPQAERIKDPNGTYTEDAVSFFNKYSEKTADEFVQNDSESGLIIKPINETTQDKVQPDGTKYKTDQKKEDLLSKSWFHGENVKNQAGGDKFYSASENVSGDYGNGKSNKLSDSEKPKNPLVVGDKRELADLIGYKNDPLTEPFDTPDNEKFDILAKEYAKEKGHDAIIYESGTFDEPELHLFENEETKTEVPDSSEGQGAITEETDKNIGQSEENAKSETNKIKENAKSIIEGKSIFNRLSLPEEQGRIAGGQRNVEASLVVGEEKGTGSEAEQSKRQEQRLEDYAKKEGIWYPDYDTRFGEQIGRGMEATVYAGDGDSVVKAMDMYYAKDPQDFLDRLALTNSIFPESAVELLGFARKENGDFLAIVSQKHVNAERTATSEEIRDELNKRGFTHLKRNDYTNGDHILEDITPDNVLVDKEGNLHFIDTRVSLNTKEFGGGDRIVGDNSVTDVENIGEPPAPPIIPPVDNSVPSPNDRDKEDLVINRVLSRRVMAENYPTLFKENIVKQQDTAITQGDKQNREVSGDYVAALESDLRGVSVQSAMELKAVLGENWDMKTLDFIERSFAYNQQPGNPAQVAGILNIISTKNFQEIKETRDANKLGELAITQMRIDKAALEVSRDASLTLNMRRLYATFAQGGSMADELAQEMVLTKRQQKFRDQLAELLVTPPTEQEINEAPRPKTPKKAPKEKTVAPKKENSKATKEQIILEGAKTAQNKSFRDYIRDAKEKLKNIKC